MDWRSGSRAAGTLATRRIMDEADAPIPRARTGDRYVNLQGRTLLLPGYVIVLLVLPSGILRTPLWVFYRQMGYVKQRSMQAMEPIVALIVSLALAIAGAGYWALVFGMFAGAWSVAIVVALNSP